MERGTTLPGILALVAAEAEREELLSAVRGWLGQCSLEAVQHDPCTFFFSVRMRDRAPGAVVHVASQPLQLTSYVVYDREIPEDRRAAFSTFAVRANFDLALGTFEYHPESGLLRHRSSLVVDGLPRTVSLVAHVIEPGMWSFATHLPAIDAIVAGAEPVEALASLRAELGGQP